MQGWKGGVKGSEMLYQAIFEDWQQVVAREFGIPKAEIVIKNIAMTFELDGVDVDLIPTPSAASLGTGMVRT